MHCSIITCATRVCLIGAWSAGKVRLRFRSDGARMWGIALADFRDRLERKKLRGGQVD